MNRPNMALYMMWENSKKERYNVGLFVQTEDSYYLEVRDKEKMAEDLSNEYVGIPGLRPGEIYKSPRVFDFIQRRITKDELYNPAEALMNRNGGRSQVDSYFFESVSKALVDSKIQYIKDKYDKQEAAKRINAENNSDFDIDDEEL